jgi:hypothetical protein
MKKLTADDADPPTPRLRRNTDGRGGVVAQIVNLLYRRLAVGKPALAGYQPATQQTTSLRYDQIFVGRLTQPSYNFVTTVKTYPKRPTYFPKQASSESNSTDGFESRPYLSWIVRVKYQVGTFLQNVRLISDEGGQAGNAIRRTAWRAVPT